MTLNENTQVTSGADGHCVKDASGNTIQCFPNTADGLKSAKQFMYKNYKNLNVKPEVPVPAPETVPAPVQTTENTLKRDNHMKTLEEMFNDALNETVTGLNYTSSDDPTQEETVSITGHGIDTNELIGMLKLAGMPSIELPINGADDHHEHHEGCGCDMEVMPVADHTDHHEGCGCDMGLEEELANSPNEMHANSDMMLNKLAGGINKPKDPYRGSHGGDNPLTLDKLSEVDYKDDEKEAPLPLMNAIIYRIMRQHEILVLEYDLDAILDAITEVAEFYGNQGVYSGELGSSDVSNMTNEVINILRGSTGPGPREEEELDFNENAENIDERVNIVPLPRKDSYSWDGDDESSKDDPDSFSFHGDASDQDRTKWDQDSLEWDEYGEYKQRKSLADRGLPQNPLSKPGITQTERDAIHRERDMQNLRDRGHPTGRIEGGYNAWRQDRKHERESGKANPYSKEKAWDKFTKPGKDKAQRAPAGTSEKIVPIPSPDVKRVPTKKSWDI